MPQDVSPQADRIKEALDQLRIKDDLFCAGLPGYPANFTRDGFTYGLIANNVASLESQVDYCSQFQGTKQDPMTGEEPGKIHHEEPGVLYRNKFTTYNACDSTALFLISICVLVNTHGNSSLFKKYEDAIAASVAYIKTHVTEGIFYEDPSLAGADDFALRVTYWKDSVINSSDEQAHYPIVYSLSQFQNALALLQAGALLGDTSLSELAAEMYVSGIEKLWKNDHFVTAIQSSGNVIDPPSSDSLHCLLYIPHEHLPAGFGQLIVEYSAQLETQAGYRTGIPLAGLSDNYHTNYVWSHEQSLLDCAARYHGLDHPQEVSQRIIPYLLETFPELVEATTFEKAGNPLQLWAIGALEYFTKEKNSLYNPFMI